MRLVIPRPKHFIMYPYHSYWVYNKLFDINFKVGWLIPGSDEKQTIDGNGNWWFFYYDTTKGNWELL